MLDLAKLNSAQGLTEQAFPPSSANDGPHSLPHSFARRTMGLTTASNDGLHFPRPAFFRVVSLTTPDEDTAVVTHGWTRQGEHPLPGWHQHPLVPQTRAAADRVFAQTAPPAQTPPARSSSSDPLPEPQTSDPPDTPLTTPNILPLLPLDAPQTIRAVSGEGNLLYANYAEGTISSAPSYFSMDDPTLFWMNRRPYRVCKALGRGGGGIVTKVELLIPFGFVVARDPQGAPLWRAEDRCCVILWPVVEGSSGSAGDDCCCSDTCDAAVGRRQPSGEPRLKPSGGPRLKPSGVYYALKTVTAETPKALKECRKEVRILESLSDCEHVIRVYDHAVLSETDALPQLFILMELGCSDFAKYAFGHTGPG